MTSVNLQFFWDLAKPEAELRQEAASTLIQYLQEVQTKQSDAEELSDDLEYTLKRLVKGLCSSRAAARQGFALALTEILVTFKDLISTAKFQELEQEYVSLAAHTNRKEKREFYFGRIFVAVIYCRSGRLADLSVESEVLTMVQQLEEFSKKVHLREIAFDSIRLIIDSLDFQVFFEHLYPYLMSKFFQGADVSTCSPEEISLGLAIKHKHSQYKKKRSQNKKAFPKLQISDTLKHLLSTKNFSLLSTTLAAASHTHPRVHSVWNHVFDILLSNLSDDGDSDDAKTPKWALFWKAVVDEGLFSSANDRRKYLGFQLFDYLLKRLVASSSSSSASVPHINVLFGKFFMRCLVNNLWFKKGGKKTHLHKCAQRTLESMLSVCKDNPALSLDIVNEFISKGGRHFDHNTKTKTISTLLKNLDADAVKTYIAQMFELFGSEFKRNKDPAPLSDTASEDTATAVPESVQIWVVDQLFLLSKNAHLPRYSQGSDPDPANSWMADLLKFFFRNGFCRVAGEAEARDGDSEAESDDDMVTDAGVVPLAISARVQGKCQSHFLSALNQLLPQERKGKTKGAKKSANDNDEDKDADKDAETEGNSGSDDKQQKYLDTFAWDKFAHSYWSSLMNQDFKIQEEFGLYEMAARHQMLNMVTSLQNIIDPLPVSADADEAEATPSKKKKKKSKKKQKKASPAPAVVAVDLETSRKMKAMNLLLTHVGFLQLTDPETATGLIQELLIVCHKAFAASLPKANITGDENVDNMNEIDIDMDMEELDVDQEIPHIEVLVEILLSLCSMASNLLRDVCKRVFLAFCGDMNAEALHTLLRVVHAKKDKEEEEEQEEGGEMDMEEEEEDSEAEAEPSDASDSDSDSEEEQIERQKKKAKAAPAAMQEGSDEEEEEIIGMDGLADLLGSELTEEEKVAAAAARESALANNDPMDKLLSNMVAMRKQKKKDIKEQRMQEKHFKFRALDLIEIFIRRQSHNPLILNVFASMMNALSHQRTTEKQDFMNRVMSIFKSKLIKPAKYPSVCYSEKEADRADNQVSIVTVRELMQTMMQRAAKTAHRDSLTLINLTLIYLTRLGAPHALVGYSQGGEVEKSTAAGMKTHGQWVSALYSESLNQFMTKKNSHFNTKFFVTFIQRFPTLAWGLFPTLLKFNTTQSSEVPNDFVRNEGVMLMSQITKLQKCNGDLPVVKKELTDMSEDIGKAIHLILLDMQRLAEEELGGKTETETETKEEEEGEKKGKKGKKKQNKQVKVSKALGKKINLMKSALKFGCDILTLAKRTEIPRWAVESLAGRELKLALGALPAGAVGMIKNPMNNFLSNVKGAAVKVGAGQKGKSKKSNGNGNAHANGSSNGNGKADTEVNGHVEEKKKKKRKAEEDVSAEEPKKKKKKSKKKSSKK